MLMRGPLNRHPALVAGLLALSMAAGCARGDRVADPAGAVERGTRASADLVLLNGKLVTLDPARPEAQALAARDGDIVAVGSDAEIRAWAGPATEVIDLGGRLAVPGFVEGHAHLTSLGEALMNVDLTGAETWEEVVHRVAVAARASPPGRWVRGRGWHQEKWAHLPQPAVEGNPVHDRLSELTPDNPVLLTHASGHAAIANARALELAGVDASTPDPPGGRILRRPDGRPSGVLRETAAGLVGRAYAAALALRTPAELAAYEERAVELAVEECLSKGVTSFQDAGSSFATVDLLKRMADQGRLGLRVWMMLRESNEALRARGAGYRLIDYADHRLTVRAIKRSIDGALGSHGAWLLEPYADLPDTAGLNTYPVDDLKQTAQLALDLDLQLCVHAIGDRGNRETLDVYERALGSRPDGKTLRWRIEHAQHLDPADIPRFAPLGVIASMQSVHCTSDGPWVPTRIGMRRAAEGAYVWRKLRHAGVVVSNGTDAPVEDVDPIPNFHAAVTRQMSDGRAFFPEQRMTREEALRSMTLDAAYAAFEETWKGSLEPGRVADVVVLSRDIMTVPEDEIRGALVLTTIVGGEVAYRRGPE